MILVLPDQLRQLLAGVFIEGVRVVQAIDQRQLRLDDQTAAIAEVVEQGSVLIVGEADSGTAQLADQVVVLTMLMVVVSTRHHQILC